MANPKKPAGVGSTPVSGGAAPLVGSTDPVVVSAAKVVDDEFMTFDEVLEKISINETKLKRLVCEGEIRAWRDDRPENPAKMKFRRSDVENLDVTGTSSEEESGLPDDLIFDEGDDLDLSPFAVFPVTPEPAKPAVGKTVSVEKTETTTTTRVEDASVVPVTEPVRTPPIPAPPAPPKSPRTPKVGVAKEENGCRHTIKFVSGKPVVSATCRCGKCRPVQQVVVLPTETDDRVVVPPTPVEPRPTVVPPKRGLPWWAWLLIVLATLAALNLLLAAIKTLDKASKETAQAAPAVVTVDSTVTEAKLEAENASLKADKAMVLAKIADTKAEKASGAVAQVTVESSDHESRIRGLESAKGPAKQEANPASREPLPKLTLDVTTQSDIITEFLTDLRMVEDHARNGASGPVDLAIRKMRAKPNFSDIKAMGRSALLAKIKEAGDIDLAFAEVVLGKLQIK